MFSKQEEKDVFEMAFQIIQQLYPEDYSNVLSRYQTQLENCEDGKIDWKQVIPTCYGYITAINLIGDLIHDAARQKEIPQLGSLKVFIERVILRRKTLLDRHRFNSLESGDIENLDTQKIRYGQYEELKAWKDFLFKIKDCELVKSQKPKNWVLIVVAILIFLVLIFAFLGMFKIIPILVWLLTMFFLIIILIGIIKFTF